MNNSPIDPERIAALLDGKVSEQQRTELLEQLADSEEDLGALADAIHVAGEVQGVAAPRPRSDSERARVWRRPLWNRRGPLVAIAAMLAAVAILPFLWTRAQSRSGITPAEFAAMLNGGAALPEDWNVRAWSSTRGRGASLTEEARAFRVGALLVDLELAVAGQDPAAVEIAAQVTELLTESAAGSAAAALYREVGRRMQDGTGEVDHLLAQGESAASDLLPSAHLRFGAWTEAARLAAARQDRRFFIDDASAASLQGGEGLPALPAAARAEIVALRAALQAEPVDWSQIEDHLWELASALGR